MNVDVFKVANNTVKMEDVLYKYSKVKINRAGKCSCPFHEDRHPSFKVYKSSNSFYCFSCGVGGDAIKFVSLLYQVKSLDALKKIDDDFCLELFKEADKEKKREYKKITKKINLTRKNEEKELQDKINLENLIHEYEKVCKELAPKIGEEPSRAFIDSKIKYNEYMDEHNRKYTVL
jgi:DNA primase